MKHAILNIHALTGLGDVCDEESNFYDEMECDLLIQQELDVEAGRKEAGTGKGWDFANNLLQSVSAIFGGGANQLQQQNALLQQQQIDNRRLTWATLTWEAFQVLTPTEKRLFVQWFPASEIAQRYRRNQMLKWGAIIGGSVLVVGGVVYAVTRK